MDLGRGILHRQILLVIPVDAAGIPHHQRVVGLAVRKDHQQTVLRVVPPHHLRGKADPETVPVGTGGEIAENLLILFILPVVPEQIHDRISVHGTEGVYAAGNSAPGQAFRDHISLGRDHPVPYGLGSGCVQKNVRREIPQVFLMDLPEHPVVRKQLCPPELSGHQFSGLGTQRMLVQVHEDRIPDLLCQTEHRCPVGLSFRQIGPAVFLTLLQGVLLNMKTYPVGAELRRIFSPGHIELRVFVDPGAAVLLHPEQFPVGKHRPSEILADKLPYSFLRPLLRDHICGAEKVRDDPALRLLVHMLAVGKGQPAQGCRHRSPPFGPLCREEMEGRYKGRKEEGSAGFIFLRRPFLRCISAVLCQNVPEASGQISAAAGNFRFFGAFTCRGASC